MLGSSESWEPQEAPRQWHSRASGGAVQTIKAGHSALRQRPLFNHLVGAGKKDGGKLEFQLSSDTKVYGESEAVGKLDW